VRESTQNRASTKIGCGAEPARAAQAGESSPAPKREGVPGALGVFEEERITSRSGRSIPTIKGTSGE
jgi:hypothetical protein